ncbi:MAG: AEC family transporter [Verrucomicrobiales bacterium]|nr:AEC family transporter [Verrucomicrobiales bacterium]
MPSFVTILSATAPVFLVMGLGCAMQRRGWLGEELEIGTMRLVLNMFLPCLILTVIPGNPALEKISSAVWTVGTGFFLVLIGFAVALTVGWMVRLKKGDGLRTFTICAGIQNYGYLPIPIIAELFSDDSGPMGLVFVHGIGVEIAMWSVGLLILTRKSGWRSILNGPFVAVFAALIINYTGLYNYIPAVITTAMKMLGQCAIPVSIFMIGATMGGFLKRDVFSDAWRVSFSSVVVRMVLLSAIILILAKFLPMPADLKTLLVIQAAMPSAVFPIMLARMYGGSPSVAIQVVLATAIVSVATSPLLISFGLRWVNGGY